MNSYILIEGPSSVQGSLAWHKFRRGKISASMAPTIMNENPFQTRTELWNSIIFEKDKPQSPAMKRGTEMESKAREWVNKVTGREYKPMVVQSIPYPDIIASLDGYYLDEKGKVHILEIKCGKTSHKIALEGQVAPWYHAQLQHQMNIVGVDEMLYASYDDEDGGVILPCEKSEEYCARLLTEELNFFTSIINFRAPEPGT